VQYATVRLTIWLKLYMRVQVMQYHGTGIISSFA